jgi:hypothetical protein
MKKISMNKWFSLPWLGRETYSELMRAGLKYDKRLGYQLTSSTDISRALSILSRSLADQVVLVRSCFVCDKPMEEESGEEFTICVECMKNQNAYDLYCLRFAKLMETI